MNQRLLNSKVESNREAIELYLVSDEGAIELNDIQKRLLERWQYADEIIRQQEIRDRESQAKMIMRKFSVSRITAYQDIVNAEAVFASSTPLNKRYRIQSRIEFLENKIDELFGRVRTSPDEGEDILNKAARMEANEEYLTQAIQLEKVLQKYYHDYPDITLARPPRNVIYNILFNKMPAAEMTMEEALAEAQKVIEINPNEIDRDSK